MNADGYNGNDHLLLDYGFAEAPRAGQLGSESLWLDAERALEVVLAVDDLGLERTVAGLAQQALRRESSMEATPSPSSTGGEPTAEDMKAAVRGALVRACEAALGHMPTSLSADQSELMGEQGHSSHRRQAALTYRVAQKEYLSRSIEILRGLGPSASPSVEGSLLDPLRRE